MLTEVFKLQHGRNIEAYISDMIVKNKRHGGYLKDLQETFDQIWYYNMRLNPQKCVFGTTSGKFL